MFEPVIAMIAFALIMLTIAVVAVVAYVRRRMIRGSGTGAAYRIVHPDGWRAADDVPAEDHASQDRARRDRSRAVNE